MFVELGAGLAPSPGCWTLDIDAAVSPHVVGDVRCLPFRSASVTHLVAVDVLEHVPWAEAAAVMAEWVRVIALGGVLTVRVPDAESEMRRLVEKASMDMARANWHLLGTPDVPWQGHQTLYSVDSLGGLLTTAGLEVQGWERDSHPNVSMTAVRL